MKKKRAAVAAVASCMALTAALSGCSLVTTINSKDMEQVIVTVDISQSDKFAESGLDAYKSAISSDSIKKRELVSYFINVGYSYVQNGSAVSDVFEMLVDALVENNVLTQYSTLALLKEKSEGDSKVLETFNAFETEVEKYEYLLGGEDSDRVRLAKYSLFTSLNNALDSYEKTLVTSSTEYSGTDTRTTPTNVDTEQDDYYPKNAEGALDYNVYTGYEGYLLAQSGAYKDDALDGTTRSTRIKAYTEFIRYLRKNGLVEGETNLKDIWSLTYVQDEYVNQLKSQVVNEYYDVYEDQMDALLKDGGEYTYIDNLYKKLLNDQKEEYSTYSAFETAIGSMSSTSFVLYSPSTEDADKYGDTATTYGFVYNILLPYSTRQSRDLSALSSVYAVDDDANAYYSGRNALLRQIETEDQRSAWFNGSTDYSFKASDAGIDDYYGKDGGRNYLFFEGNLTDNVRYKELQAYDGRYSYNGTVSENDDGSYTLIGNKLSIDGMIEEFSAYIDYVLGATGSVTFDNGYTLGQENGDYYEVGDFYKYENGEIVTDDDGVKEIDYSKFVYVSGMVDLNSFSRSDMFNAESTQYKVMSAVNELQYAYTTDTGVLSQYVGYSVSAYDTDYIKEFEYASQLALSKGAGAFAVCAGDYGWHLIYVTYAFDTEGGNVYVPDWVNNIDKEGTFENLFYEWIKSNDLSDISTARRSKIISDFNNDSTVVTYQSRYQDLLDLGN